MTADFGLEDPNKLLKPSDNSEVGNNLLHGVWQPSERNGMRVPKVPGIPPFSEEVHLEKASSLQTYLDKQAITAGDNTAGAMVGALRNTNDPYRGDRALAILDTATGREARMNQAFPFVPLTPQYVEPDGFRTYRLELASGLNDNNVGSDNAYVGARQADAAHHINDRNNFAQAVESDAGQIVDLVHKHDLHGALQEYDRLIGAFTRRHYDYPDMAHQYVQGLDYELEQNKVFGQLQQESNAEFR